MRAGPCGALLFPVDETQRLWHRLLTMTNTTNTTTLRGDSCPHCGDYMDFTKAGKLWKHGRAATGAGRKGCPGSGLTRAQIETLRAERAKAEADRVTEAEIALAMADAGR